MLWTFKYSSDVDMLTLLSYATVFGYFFQKLVDFLQSSGHTVEHIRGGSVAGNHQYDEDNKSFLKLFLRAIRNVRVNAP